MGLFSTKSKTEQKTTVYNQQVGASEGAFAVGAGANVNISTLDAGLAETAIREIGDTSGLAITTTADTVRGTAQDAFSFASRQQDSLNAQNENFLQFARSQGELVAASRGVETPDTSRTLVYVIGAAFLAGAVLLFRKQKGA